VELVQEIIEEPERNLRRRMRSNDKRQQEEGQDAAGGRTGSSRRKDKRQQEEGQEAAYNLSFLLLQLDLPLAHAWESWFTHSLSFFLTGLLKESQGDPSGTCTRNHGGT
jgi:hypothetical protein